MQQIRLVVAVVLAKCITIITTARNGGGTAAPGYYALKIQPNLIAMLSQRLPKGTIVVAGTNGKTTTSRMIAAMLSADHISYIHNKEGSNLLRGFASTLANHTSLTGKPNADYALWEVDEATLPQLLSTVTPKIIVLTNLFRDQLDRYGEVAKIRQTWENAFASLPKETILIVNADDPSLAYLGQRATCSVLYYGISLPSQSDHIVTSADANFCPICQTPLLYSAIYYSHLGIYHCPKGDFSRPTPTITAESVELGETKTSFHLATGQNSTEEIMIPLPGVYNLYNSLSALAIGRLLQGNFATMAESLQTFRSAFGRVETIAIQGKTLKLFLIKNPTGFNEVINTLRLHHSAPFRLAIGINDNFADGTDVSWLWDVEVEQLHRIAETIICTGIRAYDMAVRLKYANVSNYQVTESLEQILNDFLASKATELIFLPTYTEMLALRKLLVAKGYINHYLA